MTLRATGRVVSLILVLAAALPAAAAAGSPQNARVVALPAPDKTGGRPLMQVLSDRRSQREFAPTPLPDQVLSNLLWAAFGINRPDGHRTAPSARNWREMKVYVARADGLYLYDPKAHALQLVVSEDLRAATGGQAFVADAPVNLVYVADSEEGDRRRARHPDALHGGRHGRHRPERLSLLRLGRPRLCRAGHDRPGHAGEASATQS